MKLKKVLIQNYRSIVDTGPVDVEDGVTVVIGKNEQGKTTFVSAIRAFNIAHRFSPNDLPNHLRPELEGRDSATLPIVTLWFCIEPQDHDRLEATCRNIKDAVGIKCTKYYDNTYKYSLINSDGKEGLLEHAPRDLAPSRAKIKRIADVLRDKLESHAKRTPAFGANTDVLNQIIASLTEAKLTDPADANDLIRTFTTSIKGLSGQDQAILDDISQATNDLERVKETIQAEDTADPTRILQDTLPHFVLHSATCDRIPNEVAIPEFVMNPEDTSKGMANLCRAAGLSMQKIRELAGTSNTAERETYEDHYKATISGGLNEFWTQADYHVHFRIERDRLSVSISDGTYAQRIPPSDRSEGFQWYFSFYATLINDVGVAKERILLLDNPALELHLDGQRDVKRFLEEKIAPTSQVIYVTHSPAMIDPFQLQQVRAVELQPNQKGTKIRNFLSKAAQDADLLEPVRAAMGMSIVSSLLFNEWNILVEGAADKPIVEGIFVSHYREHRPKIVVNGSLSESKDAFLVRFYQRTGLPYVVILDADSGGRELEQELLRNGIPEGRIVKLRNVFPSRQGDFAIEDVLTSEFYHQAVVKAYPSQPVECPSETNRKRTSLYEQLFRRKHQIGFNKRRVAEAVRQLLNEQREDAQTRENLGLLSGAIVKCLMTEHRAFGLSANEASANTLT